jgi:hypothetical protein
MKRIFPKYTGYKTQFITIKERGGESLLAEIEKKLGDKFDPVYEAPDVPYAYYTVLKGTVTIGRVHGVNQKGKYGGMQLILATDLEGRIIKFYYQRISSPEAKKFKVPSFTAQFKNLTLSDFYRHDIKYPGDKIAKIKDPSKKSYKDFKATLRGVKKNLILLDKFILNNKYDSVLKELQKEMKEKEEKLLEKGKEKKDETKK